MNQEGNQGDDSTGQHYSVTEHTLHMLIRAREEERGSDGGSKRTRWRDGVKKKKVGRLSLKQMQKKKIKKLSWLCG